MLASHKLCFVGHSKASFSFLLQQSLMIHRVLFNFASAETSNTFSVSTQRTLTGWLVKIFFSGTSPISGLFVRLLLEKHLELFVCKGVPVNLRLFKPSITKVSTAFVYPELAECFYIPAKFPRAFFFSRFIKYLFEKDPKHSVLFQQLEGNFRELYYSKQNSVVSGLFFRVKGRVNGADRSRAMSCLFGKMPNQSRGSLLDSGYSEAFTAYGVFGISVTIYFNAV